MRVPSKAKAIKLDNPAQVKSNQHPETKLHILGGNGSVRGVIPPCILLIKI